MVLNVFSRIESLRSRNAKNTDAVNNDLFRVLCSRDLLTISYNKIKSKPGNVIPDTYGETLDGFSENLIQEIIFQLKDKSFKFKSVKKKYIFKETSKKSSLEIFSLRDKVVHQSMLFILEAIYEPILLEGIHGFRKGHSCHTALKKFKSSWSEVMWIIEGDIPGCYDNVDHHILINIFKKKINDECFIGLIWKSLRAGVVEDGKSIQSFFGTPLGGIMSSLLANIYLNNLDNFVQKIISENDSIKRRRFNLEYESMKSKIKLFKILRQSNRTSLINFSKKNLLEITKLKEMQKTISSKNQFDALYTKVLFTRYADDWILGVTGPYSLAVDIKRKIQEFLAKDLKLALCQEKTKIICVSKGNIQYLGYYIRQGGYSRNFSNAVLNKRNTSWPPRIFVPMDLIIQKLAKQHFCTKFGRAQRKKGWTLYSDNIIIEKYNIILKGIRHYYAPTDNFETSMNRIEFILRYSCAHTLANKHGTRISKQLSRLPELGLDIKVKKTIFRILNLRCKP